MDIEIFGNTPSLTDNDVRESFNDFENKRLQSFHE